MSVEGTTFTLGNEDDGYVQRNFAYNNVLGSIRHIPPFHHDYMMYEAISPRVNLGREKLSSENDICGAGDMCAEGNDKLSVWGVSLGYKWPVPI